MRLVTSFYPADESCLGGGGQGGIKNEEKLAQEGVKGGGGKLGRKGNVAS